MISFTVVWEKDARDELARLWLENPLMRQEVTAAADKIDPQLAIRPLELGVQTSPRARQFAEPPLMVLYRVSEPDRMVRVIWVKFWTE
jgi:hypothetical protein